MSPLHFYQLEWRNYSCDSQTLWVAKNSNSQLLKYLFVDIIEEMAHSDDNIVCFPIKKFHKNHRRH